MFHKTSNSVNLVQSFWPGCKAAKVRTQVVLKQMFLHFDLLNTHGGNSLLPSSISCTLLYEPIQTSDDASDDENIKSKQHTNQAAICMFLL